MQKDGTLKLLIDNKEAADLATPGLFKQDLEVPIRVGIDNRRGDEKVADYPDTLFTLRANLTNCKLETLEPIVPAEVIAKADKIIVLGVIKDVMKYDKTLLTAKAGTTLQIILKNIDHMQHNFVLIKPNTSEKVGLEADKLAQSQAGSNAKLLYVPKMPEVLYATPLVNPGKSYTLNIKVPATPGDYPYLCTFPGHWRIMNGVLRVTK
jgi:azurin